MSKPFQQFSENGPRFNYKQINTSSEKRDFDIKIIAPHQPNSKLVETFMKAFDKTMKIGHTNKVRKEETLKSALEARRKIFHPESVQVCTG